MTWFFLVFYFTILKTLGSFHKLVVSKLEDDACSEAASESASFWLILFLFSCFKAVQCPVISFMWSLSVGFAVTQSMEHSDLCMHLKTIHRNGCNSADAECSCPFKSLFLTEGMVMSLLCTGFCLILSAVFTLLP